MEEEKQDESKKAEVNFSFKDITKDWGLLLISIFLQLPLFLIIKSSLPTLKWPLYTDEILLFFILFGIIILLVRTFRKVVYGLLIFLFIAMVYGMIFKDFKLTEFFGNYIEAIKYAKNSKNDNVGKIIFHKIKGETKDSLVFINLNTRVTPVINKFVAEKFKNTYLPDKMNDSMKIANDYKVAFAMFKYLKNNWIFIKDIEPNHYRASDITKDLSGDIDDFTILTLALLKSKGLSTAILYKNSYDIHPLLFIGKEKNKYTASAIINQYFSEEVNKKEIIYIEDNGGDWWLPLSFYQNYPGGEIPNCKTYNLRKVK